jgi:hypothetical protein
VKEVYILATRRADPVPLETLREALDAEEVELIVQPEEQQVTVKSGEATTEIRFEKLAGPLGWSPDFLSGTPDSQKLLQEAQGFYRISFEPGRPQSTVAVFEALWCARAVMDLVEEGALLDVTAYKLHDAEDVREITELEFDIRDHVNLHAVAVEEGQNPLWVHSHGMEKFGARDLEVFQLAEEDLPAAESFLHQLCTDLAFGQSPPLRLPVDTGDASFMLMPSEEARRSLMGVPLDAFEGHEGLFLTVLSGSGRHNVTELLTPYRDHFEDESPERAEALRQLAQALMPAFKARFLRKGLMEPLSFRVRAPFESHPDGEPVQEDLWAEVVAWEGDKVVARLVDGGAHTTEWRKGAHVRLEESTINAIALGHEGRVMEDEQLRHVLAAERPI